MKEIIFAGIEIAPELQEKILTNLQPEIKKIQASANDNANKIFDSVANTLQEKFGVPRLANETKITDYLNRLGEELNNKALVLSKSEIEKRENQIKELSEKLKAGITDETTRKKLETYEAEIGKLNDLLQSERNKIKEIETGFETKLSSIKIESLKESNLPAFDSAVNKYELKARKEEANQKLNETYNWKINENGELYGENKTTFQSKLYKDLIAEQLTDLLPKNEQQGGGAKPPIGQNRSKLVFTDDMTSEQKSEMINSHMRSLGFVSKTQKGYTDKFNELMKEAYPNKK